MPLLHALSLGLPEASHQACRERNHSFNTSFIRVCQPSPVALKASRISASKRMVVLTLLPLPAGLPRRRAISCCASGRETGLSPIFQSPCSKKSSVSSGASSGSSQALAVFCDFTFICFPHADNSACQSTLRPDQYDKTLVKPAHRDEP